jgi:hypothetical protein
VLNSAWIVGKLKLQTIVGLTAPTRRDLWLLRGTKAMIV